MGAKASTAANNGGGATTSAGATNNGGTATARATGDSAAASAVASTSAGAQSGAGGMMTSPRQRHFSTSSSGSDAGMPNGSGGGGAFNMFRSMQGSTPHHMLHPASSGAAGTTSTGTNHQHQYQAVQQPHYFQRHELHHYIAVASETVGVPFEELAAVVAASGSFVMTGDEATEATGSSGGGGGSSGGGSAHSAVSAVLASLGRVHTGNPFPLGTWSTNGIKCPVCNKFVLPDDIECHLVMCLTKPRLSYNEDVLTDAKGECVICLDDLCCGDVIARLPCLCVYHKTCIDNWFNVNRCCPEHPGE